jgi:hypothetical protein
VTLFPYGYRGAKITLEQYLTITVIRRIDSEFRRRLFAMMQAAADQKVSLGIGGAWRSSTTQERLFRARYEVSPAGEIRWNGQRWKHVRGAAAAPPGRSYHEATTEEGACLAVDMVGDLKWMKAHCAAYGLREFSEVNNEPWHLQPLDIPGGRGLYSQDKYDPLPVWKLPTPAPAPVPPDPPTLRILRQGMEGHDVAGLQDLLRTNGYSAGNSDGKFGPRTDEQVRKFQLDHGLTADGIVNQAVWAALQAD